MRDHSRSSTMSGSVASTWWKASGCERRRQHPSRRRTGWRVAVAEPVQLLGIGGPGYASRLSTTGPRGVSMPVSPGASAVLSAMHATICQARTAMRERTFLANPSRTVEDAHVVRCAIPSPPQRTIAVVPCCLLVVTTRCLPVCTGARAQTLHWASIQTAGALVLRSGQDSVAPGSMPARASRTQRWEWYRGDSVAPAARCASARSVGNGRGDPCGRPSSTLVVARVEPCMPSSAGRDKPVPLHGTSRKPLI